MYTKLQAFFRKFIRKPNQLPEYEGLQDTLLTTYIVTPFHKVFIALLITAFMCLLAIQVMIYPGGISGMLGGLLATTCVQTGQCDINILLPGLAVGLVTLNVFAFSFTMIIMGLNDDDEQNEMFDGLNNGSAVISAKIDEIYKLLKLQQKGVEEKP